MKKLLAGLFALMALGLILSGCKKDDDDDTEEEKKEEEVFTELAEADFDNSEEWFIGSWYGEIEEFDFDCSDSFAESQNKTKNELKNAFKEMLQELDIVGDMEITEDNWADYNKTIAELFSSGAAKEYVNKDKTKLRVIIDVNESQDDMWVKYKATILCTKK
ncbi:hypothetical protein [uncultured Treponema sp.]|uniref:hypothetical protein n=1 Tax=uncultured Treponema sp. TaxID=162155 RepID=UPI0025DDFBA5|nr:hypothetical protein [uncultured Treponema sp.]